MSIDWQKHSQTRAKEEREALLLQRFAIPASFTVVIGYLVIAGTWAILHHEWTWAQSSCDLASCIGAD